MSLAPVPNWTYTDLEVYCSAGPDCRHNKYRSKTIPQCALGLYCNTDSKESYCTYHIISLFLRKNMRDFQMQPGLPDER